MIADAEFKERFHARNRTFGGLTPENEGEFTEDFTFVQMADCQLGFIEENKSWDREIELLESAVEKINSLKPKPRFAILCGDMTHAFPWEGTPYEEQRDAYKRIIAGIDTSIPMLCVCGNHDVGNSPTEKYLELFDRTYGQSFYSFWVGGVHGIVLNSNIYFDPKDSKESFNLQETFLDKQLCSPRKATHRLVFSHHPWFVEDAEEKDEWCNIPKVRRVPLLEKFKAANVHTCFCGHYHQNARTHYGDMKIVVTTAIGKQLGKDMHGFRLVRVTEDSVTDEFVVISDRVN
eukprot:468446_1